MNTDLTPAEQAVVDNFTRQTGPGPPPHCRRRSRRTRRPFAAGDSRRPGHFTSRSDALASKI